jgi:hypothetical protein
MQWCYINNGTLVTILIWNEEGSRRHDEPCAVELAVKIKKVYCSQSTLVLFLTRGYKYVTWVYSSSYLVCEVYHQVIVIFLHLQCRA